TQRRVLHVIIALVASAAIILLRPLSNSDIIWTLVVAVLAVVLVSVIERPEAPVLVAPPVQPAPA
ncbi:MAG: hypothetical protein ACJ72A_19840, partial [Nocardioidaceae bacterium]